MRSSVAVVGALCVTTTLALSSSTPSHFTKKFPTVQEIMAHTDRTLATTKGRDHAVPPEKSSSSSLTTSTSKIIALVLGKPLVQGRLSVEHSARISALVRALKKTPLKPWAVAFASSSGQFSVNHGGRDKRTPTSLSLDDAPAAVTYFYHLCEAVGVEPPPAHRVFTTGPVGTRDATRKFLTSVREADDDRDDWLVGEGQYHLLLCVSDYDEHRLLKVERRTPRLSLLTTVRELLGRPASFESCSYPPGSLVHEPADAFLARLHVMVDALVPLLINLHAIVNKEEILAREYYDDLVDARRAIAQQLEFVESPMRPASLRLLTSSSKEARKLLFPEEEEDDDHQGNDDDDGRSTTREEENDHHQGVAPLLGKQDTVVFPGAAGLGQRAVARRPRRADVLLRRATSRGSPERTKFLLLDEALQSVLSILSDLERLLRPAALRTDSLTLDEWKKALTLLQRAMYQARLATDPDRPLPVIDWGRLTDLDKPHLQDGGTRHHHHQLPFGGDNNNAEHDWNGVASLYAPPPTTTSVTPPPQHS